jgi:two-component system, OmpR family, phosphate regulon sensor histidine kinase PhoR
VRKVRRKIVYGHLLLLSGGALIGWLYDHVDWGLLAAALLGLAWHVRQLLTFEQALRDKDFGNLRYADNIWSQLYSRFSYQRGRTRQYKKSYRQLVKEVRKSTNAMPDGGIILNRDFEIVFCNKAAQLLAGFRRRQDKGQRVDNILRDPEFSEYLNSEDFMPGVEIRSPLIEGGWLMCRIVPYGANQQLLLIQDITERRRLLAMRRDFVANASHELRTPLTVVSGYLDTLALDDEIPAHWRQPVSQMQTQADRMNQIVAELLELSRLECAGSAPADEVVDVCSLLNTARNSLAGQQHIPHIDIDCQSQSKLYGSTAEIESVIVNLLSNAIRHTPEDGQITAAWTSDDGRVQLSVTDTGAGIESEHIPRLTERFFRVDAGRSRDDGGVGLGLAIVKHILERHDACLQIESTPGSGSRFSCQFAQERIVAATPGQSTRNQNET